MGRMYGTCSECANRQQGKRYWGNHFGPGCTAELDGVHPLGWGHQEEDEEPERNERGMIVCKPCYYFREKGQKERACKAIEEQFGQQADTEEADEPIRNLLKHIAELIVEEKLDSASLDIGNGLKAKLSITSKGYIKVERKKTEKAVQEA